MVDTPEDESNLLRWRRDAGDSIPSPVAIESKNHSLNTRGLESYYMWFESEGGNRQLVQKLVGKIRLIDSEEIESSIGNMRKSVEDFVEGGEFTAVAVIGGSSPYFTKEVLGMNTDIIDTNTAFGKGRLASVDKNKKVIIIDDASYTTGSLSDTLKYLIEERDVKPENIMISLIGVTNYSRNQLRDNFGIENVQATFVIPTIEEEFTEEEAQKLHEIGTTRGGARNPKTAVLTAFRTKVPDNFYGAAKRSIVAEGDPYLIDDTKHGKLYPPYKST